EDHARQPQLPQDRVVGARERRMKSEDVRERRLDDVHRSQVDRADERADEQRRRQERDRGRKPEPRRSPHRLVWLVRLNAFATARTKETMRGPPREAAEPSTAPTACERNAVSPLQPGRVWTGDADRA